MMIKNEDGNNENKHFDDSNENSGFQHLLKK